MPEIKRSGALEGNRKSCGTSIQMPKNYYENNDCKNKPLLLWRAHANNLYTNWLNYYVYQSTPFDLIGTPDFSSISMD